MWVGYGGWAVKKRTLKNLLIVLASLLGLAAAAFFAFLGINTHRLKTCAHESWDNGVCLTCGYVCGHDWEDGACIHCGMVYDHKWENGVCSICRIPCPHQWEHGTCTVCGMVCSHEQYKNGICFACGEVCSHEWYDGVCTVCGMVCQHVQHDMDGFCTSCGEKQLHHYVNGACVCGAQPIVYTHALPHEFFDMCSEQGSVQVVNYSAPLYAAQSVTVSKKMSVYLPYGYSEDKKYNVLVMIHGASGSDGDWMDNIIDTEHGTAVCMRNLYDYMIQQRIIEPLIIVSPYTDSYVPGGGFMDTGPEQFAQEVKAIILPYIVDHYSTYAENGSPEELQAARAHFGIGGCSNGALYVERAGMAENLGIFSNFVCLSGFSYVRDVVKSLESQDLSVSYLYAGAGTVDAQKDSVIDGYEYIVDHSEKLTEGENAHIEIVTGSHTWDTWAALFFNAAQLLFQSE